MIKAWIQWKYYALASTYWKMIGQSCQDETLKVDIMVKSWRLFCRAAAYEVRYYTLRKREGFK